jgi:hypothetical protein
MSGELKSDFAIEMERRARQAARDDARRARGEQRSRTYTGDDLRSLYRIDPATGCWLWTGDFRTYGDATREIPIGTGLGKHLMCGIAHNAMSRVLFEEHLGRKLKATENVAATCDSNRGVRHACVNPQHHVLRRGAGIMFAHDMIE